MHQHSTKQLEREHFTGFILHENLIQCQERGTNSISGSELLQNSLGINPSHHQDQTWSGQQQPTGIRHRESLPENPQLWVTRSWHEANLAWSQHSSSSPDCTSESCSAKGSSAFLIYSFSLQAGYTWNLLFAEASKLGSRGRLHDCQNNWGELGLDGAVMTKALGDISQMFPDAEQKLHANPTSKQ